MLDAIPWVCVEATMLILACGAVGAILGGIVAMLRKG
ncbi:MAG: hypothetical protein JWM36_4876 [Hyphomicrobiales bacterium]|jgi:hypothetical protein|nr:hypothetical protein [Hyphomicrobiales bacterium]